MTPYEMKEEILRLRGELHCLLGQFDSTDGGDNYESRMDSEQYEAFERAAKLNEEVKDQDS